MSIVMLAAGLFLSQYSTPEGPDGLVYKQGYTASRFAVLRKGRWDTWVFKGYPGNGGQRVTLTPAEAAQVEGQLKKIASIVESTPYAQALTGWYANRSAGWINSRFATPEFSLQKLPVESYYALYPFHLMDLKKKVNGVEQWVPDWSQETVSIHYRVNASIPGPPASLILRKDNEDGSLTRLYADPQPETSFHGFPIYDGALVISRKDRPLFRPVSVERALIHFLPLYRQDRQTAEDRLKSLKQQQEKADSPAFAMEAMDSFEKQYGHLKASSPRDYELRLKTRTDWIARQRAEARAAGNPDEASRAGAWYWQPVRALEAVERLQHSADVQKPACFEAAPASNALYATRGHLRASGPTEGCKPVMEPNPEYFEADLPRTAPQLLTLWLINRCLDTSRKPPPPLPQDQLIPHGCNIHAKIWDQLDWKSLEAVLAH